jgi:ABC-2 type transport system ATP-binding protein
MKQKLGLACVLLRTPDALLLDEPGSGSIPSPAAPSGRWCELAKGGMTVLWSTAYLDEAELCDHVLRWRMARCAPAAPRPIWMGAMASRCWLLDSGPCRIRERRALLRRALAHQAVMDGAVAGERVACCCTRA